MYSKISRVLAKYLRDGHLQLRPGVLPPGTLRGQEGPDNLMRIYRLLSEGAQGLITVSMRK